jgi:hypothetical protein
VYRLTIFAITLFLSGSVLAQGGYVDCASTDKQAVLQIPPPADKLARVSCTKWGHIIQPVVNWIWTQPGGYRPVFFPAQMVATNPKETGNDDYFVDIRVRELPAGETSEKWKLVSTTIPGQMTADLRALAIIAKNRKSQSHTIYLFNSGWGYGCSPKCAKETIFLLVNKEKQKVSW